MITRKLTIAAKMQKSRNKWSTKWFVGITRKAIATSVIVVGQTKCICLILRVHINSIIILFYRYAHPENVGMASTSTNMEASSSCEPTFDERHLDLPPVDLARDLPTASNLRPPHHPQVYNEVHIVLNLWR